MGIGPHATQLRPRLWKGVVLATFCTSGSAGAGPAVLETQVGGHVQRHSAIFAEWSIPEGLVTAIPVVKDESDPFACHELQWCEGCALVALQGNCTFALKARNAQVAGMKLLIVSSARDGPLSIMSAASAAHMPSMQAPRITALMVSKTTGRQLLLSLAGSNEVKVSCWAYKEGWRDFCGEMVIGFLAVGMIVLGAWHSVEDLRRPGAPSNFHELVVAVEESSGPQFVLLGSLMLTVLFFLMKYLIYLLLFVFASGAVSTTSMLLEPIISARHPMLRERRACRLPRWVGGILGTAEDHTLADAIAECIGFVLAIAFLLFRNHSIVGWMLQDLIAIMLLLTIQRTVRLPNLKVGTLLLLCTFFFDIFWVFLSPLIFKKSVMIEVATGGGTGQSVPMVLKIPSLSGNLPGEFKILGLGDIAIPGLLVSMLLRHDLVQQNVWPQGYFCAGVIGYALGLVATFVSLYLTKHGQPALLFLVPGTLVPTFLIAWSKNEVSSFWHADYGPEVLPEDYHALPDSADKMA
mmetsp:Transcript_101478/g.185859  ORF Transcript_101478/g.185859 Transcript_101478/m.185859 type:complete len:521 (+) Transcript_101478:34-1596(+)